MDNNEEVISKLKFLSKIQKGEKINVNGLFVQLDCLKTTVSRTVWNVDSRQNTLTFIEKVLNNSTNLIELYLNSGNHAQFVMAQNIMKDLSESKKGIDNLKNTYTGDVMFCSKIDTFLQLIDAKLTEISTSYSHLLNFEQKDETKSVEINDDEEMSSANGE